MGKKITKYKQMLITVMKTGVISVASASVINKIVAFACNILIVRLVTQEEYGIYSAANNAVEIVLLITGLGILSGVMQFVAENRAEEEKNEFAKFGLLWGVGIDVLLTVGLILYGVFEMQPIAEVNKYIVWLSPTILLHFVYEYFGVLLRSGKRIKQYSILLNTNSVTLSILSCLGALGFGINGLVVGRTVAYTFGGLLGLFFNKDSVIAIINAKRLEREKRSDILKFSAACCISGALNRALYLIDTLLITYLVANAENVAIYKVGTQIPEALEFIPYSILIAIMPHIIEHNDNSAWLKKWIKRVYLYSICVNAVITVGLILFAPLIINLFWGSEYAESIKIFRILSLNYFVMASFRQLGTNILSALKRVRYNMIISVIACVVNIFMDYFMVKKYGIMGAAYATLIVVTIASLLSFPYIIAVVYGKKAD